MARAELTAITIERFKSYRERTTLEVAPLTVLLGRNNSGKSTLIQALLLLKQTLEHPRGDVPLYLEGPVDALNLRELTSGWPGDKAFDGPVLDCAISHGRSTCYCCPGACRCGAFARCSTRWASRGWTSWRAS